MVTLHGMRNVDGDRKYAYDFCGLSTDEKPTSWGGREIEDNSLFLELDTGDFYYFSDGAWSKVGSGSEPTDGYEINNPVLSLNVTNSLEYPPELYKTAVDENGYLTEYDVVIESGETVQYDTVVYCQEDGRYSGLPDNSYWYNFSGYDITVSNCVNCSEVDDYLVVTDPTKNASADVTIAEGE